MGEVSPESYSIMASLKSKRPTKKHDEFTLVEDDAIISGARTCSGQNKWSIVKLMFPVELANRNRTQIRCRWNFCSQDKQTKK